MTEASHIAAAVRQLRAEHDALETLALGLEPTDLDRSSFASDWTIAQVFSHLGSGGEINSSNLSAVLGKGDPIPKSDFPALWKRWDETSPREQVDGFRRCHGQLVGLLEDLSDSAPEAEVESAMGTLRLADVAGMRLREAALHRWDIAVVLDPSARLAPASVPFLLDQLPSMIGRLIDNKSASSSDLKSVVIRGHGPDRSYLLSLSSPPSLVEPSDSTAEAFVALPSEALVRLFCGRFVPGSEESEVHQEPDGALASLLALFRGF